MKSKRGNRIKKLIGILIVLILLLAVVIVLFNRSPISGNAVLNPEVPPNYCSNESVKALWDTIFIESSSNIKIFFYETFDNDPVLIDQIPACPAFFAYKIVGSKAYILQDAYLYQSKTPPAEATALEIIYGDFKTTYLNKLNALTNISNTAQYESLEFSEGDYDSGFMVPEKYYNLRSKGNNLTEAGLEFSQVFKINSGTLTTNYSASNVTYRFDEREYGDINYTYFGSIHANYTNIKFNFAKRLQLSCSPNWIPKNTSCNSGETLTTYYDEESDTHKCNQTLPENITISCDYNHDAIFGNSENFTFRIYDSMYEDIIPYINGTSNLTSQNFTNHYLNVELKGNSKTYVEFSWNFTNPLDLNQIYIEKQGSGNKGYLLVKNLHAPKTIYVDRLNSSSYICAKNLEISSISAIDTYCSRRGEYLLDCPDSQGNIECELEENYFKITGLQNSGAIEYIDNETSCIANWNYSSWSTCLNSTQTRNATDSNDCGTISGRGTLTQSCGTTNPANGSCTSSWNCTAWSNCNTEGKQNRTCKDKKNCAIDKTETKNCEIPSTNSFSTYIFIGLIIVLVIAIVIIIMLIVMEFFSHSKKEMNIFSP